MLEIVIVKNIRIIVATGLLCFGSISANAALFEDDEARKAILDLRQRIDLIRQTSETNRLTVEQGLLSSAEDRAMLRRSLIDLQNQNETLRGEVAKLRGLNEQVTRDLAETQRQLLNVTKGVDDRLRPFEPVKVTVDGREFAADPAEKRDFDAALAVFRSGDFAGAQKRFVDFLRRNAKSGYEPSALFWLGNAQYATRDYKEAVINFRSLIAKDPEHPRVPESVLSIANCQIELKDAKGARKTLEDLVKAYPQSEAAVAAKERLTRLK